MRVLRRLKVLAIVFLVFLCSKNAFAHNERDFKAIGGLAGRYLSSTLDSCETYVGMEWTIFALKDFVTRDEYDEYKARYMNDISETLRAKKGVLSRSKYTEYSKVIILLSAFGEKDFTVAGYNLLERLKEVDKVTAQGINGAVFALIALDVSKAEGYEAVKDRYIEFILANQNPDGGFSIAGESLPDITAMVAYSLEGYASRNEVSQALDRIIKYLSENQNDDGGYSGWGITGSEYVSQVIMALCEMGISVEDKRFVKNGNTLEDALMQYYTGEGFCHVMGEGINTMATEQALYSIANLIRVREGKDRSVYNSLKEINPMPQEACFKDIDNSFGKEAIISLAQKSIVSGKGDGRFDPKSNITRAEFAAIIVNALNLEKSDTRVFKDVERGSWYESYVNTAYAHGIVSGFSENEFMPMKNITTEQAMTMIAKSAKLLGRDIEYSSYKEVLNVFSDADEISDWSEGYVIYCIKNNIFWKSAGAVNSGEYVKRDEMAQMIYNFLKNEKRI